MKSPADSLRLTPILAAGAAALALGPRAEAQLDLMGGGLTIVEQGGTMDTENNLALAGIAIAKDVIAGGTLAPHQTIHLNDGIYGNSNSWIGDTADSWAGIGADQLVPVQSIAFGRDNTGMFPDRSQGTYTLQFTQDLTVLADPGAVSWTTIGTIGYGAAIDAPNYYTSSALRHRFNFDEVMASGVRLLTPAGAAIDELELYAVPGTLGPPPQAVTTTAAPGHVISWDGNDGVGFNPSSPAPVPDNLALGMGASPISSSDLGPELGIGFHVAANLNDGFYGNGNSWISASADPGPQAFAGVDLGDLHNVTSVAFGRDNTGGFTDRALGAYTLQYTQNGSDWMDAGTIEFDFNEDAVPGEGFTAPLRHEFAVGVEGGGPLVASGIRLLVPASGLGGGTAIDEIEVYGTLVPEPSSTLLAGLGALGLLLRRRRRS